MKRRWLALWGLLIITGIVCYFRFLSGDLQSLIVWAKSWTNEYALWVATAYVVVLSLRGLTFVPSTPLLFIGMAIFPPNFTYLANLVGILSSCLLVIASMRYTGVDSLIASKLTGKRANIKAALERNGVYAIVLWSFFPFAPSDAIVYAASALRLPRWQIITGVMIGEAILNAAYIYGGTMLLRLFTGG